jgi:uncharacterized protein
MDNLVRRLRVSDFSICVPIRAAGITLAVNTCWGTSVAVMTETAAKLATHDVSGLSTATIVTLIERSILTTQSSAQEKNIFQRMIVERGKKASSTATRSYLMPSYDCNLKCVYCFQHKIRHITPSMQMSEQTALAAFRYVEGSLREGDTREITLYGGEPLAPRNRSIVEFICSHARKRHFSLMSATHGWNLTKFPTPTNS